ncbi:MAG: tyrosine-type recombinase/integrase, partial [Devosia sp.]
WSRVRNVSMLKHISAPHVVRKGSVVDFGLDTRGHAADSVKFFPPKEVERLIWEGHRRPGHESHPNPFVMYNVRDQMIALLDAYGGLRRSDGLHLWVNDVVGEPGKQGHALVVLNHPSQAKVQWSDALTGRPLTLSRGEALRRMGLTPRNEQTRGKYHVGWKSLALNQDHQAFVYWLEPTAAALFWVLYLGYLRHVRTPLMEKRKAMGGYDHPFLFVSEGLSNADGGMPGDPLSPQAYERSHERAVLRMGLEHRKEEGTTTHGLRHLYGQTLSVLRVDAKVIQKGLHHRQALSQVPYTISTADHVNRVLRAALTGETVPHEPLGHESALALRDLHDYIVGGTHG